MNDLQPQFPLSPGTDPTHCYLLSLSALGLGWLGNAGGHSIPSPSQGRPGLPGGSRAGPATGSWLVTGVWTPNHPPPPPDPGVGGLKPCRGLAEKRREQPAQPGPGRFLPTGSLWLTQQPRKHFPFLSFLVPRCPEHWAEWSPATPSSRHHGRQGFSLEIQGLS